MAGVKRFCRHVNGRDNPRRCGYAGCGRPRGIMKINLMSSTLNSARQKATRIIFIWACATVSLSKEKEYFLAVEASSNSDDKGNAPFLVVSEITVQADDDGNLDTENQDDTENKGVLNRGNNQNNSGSADVTDSGSNSKNSNGDGEDTPGIDANNDVRSGGQISAGGVSSGADTDGEDENDNNGKKITGNEGLRVWKTGKSLTSVDALAKSASESLAASASQPLRTLKRLQAMLDDSDYATHTVSSAPVIGRNSNIVDDLGNAQAPVSSSSILNTNTPSPFEKLWTSKDRAKYRRTRRTEKQRQEQQQRQYKEEHARKVRDIERQRIIREETERKELEQFRRKQADIMERQKYENQKRQQLPEQLFRIDEMTDFTDDDTDMDGRGFELPNLPVYLSDAETDDFSEETDESSKIQQHSCPLHPLNYSPPNLQVNQISSQNIAQNLAQPHHYNYAEMQKSQQQQHQQPPPQVNAPHQIYEQYPPYYQQQQPQPQQQQQTVSQYQYGHNHQQMQDYQSQYERQYAAWAQAAANGYYYPPPPHPSMTSFQDQQQAFQLHHAQQNQQHLQSAYTPQYPYVTQLQQQSQGSAYATNPQQQSGPHSSTKASYSIPLQQAPFPPRSQSSQAASTYLDNEQHDFFYNQNEGGDEWPMEQQQHQHEFRYNGDGATPYYTNDPGPTALESTLVHPVEAQTEQGTSNATISTSTNIDGRMAIQSAFVAPASPLISPAPSIISLPFNEEASRYELINESDLLIAGTESNISFDSIQKLSFSTIGIALMSYCAVSPRSLPFPEYNRLFLQNLSIVWLAAIAPLISLLAVYDGKHNNINTVIGTFHVSFTLGYLLAFISEIVVTTAVRLHIFKIWEPAIFSLTPEVPSIILPWVLREKQYKPKRITLFAADFAASCVASPIIEEYLKLKVVQWTCKLPRNFKQIKKVKKSRWSRKQNMLQPVSSIDVAQVTNINCYVTQMLAASLGLKLFDVTRRILMYTKEADEYKRVYAVCRGTFPLHELCGTMTALLLARKNVLGVNLPMWKILGPAVFIHGMANFRGKKPIFKWNSSTPWSEMQMNQLKKGRHMWRQLLPKSYAKLVWLTILCRVFGFCIKNYYLIGRQAMKRTTTYSGKLHAFNAELQTDAMLKKAKD